MLGESNSLVRPLFEPLVFPQVKTIEWRAPRFDLAELAKLRWIENWSRKDLARHFGKTETAIQQYFHKLKLKKFRVQGLDRKTSQAIRRKALESAGPNRR